MIVKPNNRDLVIDLLKAVCMVLVIITHCSFTRQERTAFLFPYLVEPAVPVFMVISGYAQAMSADRRALSSPLDWFGKERLGPKLIRLAVPFLIAFTINMLYYQAHKALSFPILLFLLVTGGTGPGSYYFPVLMQFLMVFPVMLFLYRRNRVTGFLQIAFFNLAFELVMQQFGFTESFYRLCFFRYTAFVLLGIVLYDRFEALTRTLIPHAAFILGFLFLFYTSYFGYQPKIFRFWTVTSMPVAFYAFAIVYGCMRLRPFLERYASVLSPAAVVGKASYHIFLTQMVYFYTKLPAWFGQRLPARGLVILVNIFLCVCAGLLFYMAESRLTGRLFRRKPVTPPPPPSGG